MSRERITNNNDLRRLNIYTLNTVGDLLETLPDCPVKASLFATWRQLAEAEASSAVVTHVKAPASQRARQ